MLELVDHGVHDPDCTGKQEKAAAAQEKKGISELFNLDFLCPSFWASLRLLSVAFPSQLFHGHDTAYFFLEYTSALGISDLAPTRSQPPIVGGRAVIVKSS